MITTRRRRGVRTLVVAVVVGAALSVVSAAASSVKSHAQPLRAHKTITLAFVLFDATNPVEVPARRGAQDAAKKYGFTLKIVAPSPTTAQAQIALMQDLIAQKVDGILIEPTDSKALVPIINQAVKAGIPVATTELDAPGSKRSFFYYGGTPTLQQGKIQADRVAAYFKSRHAKGTVNYVVTSCLPTVTGQQDRRHGFEQEAARLNKHNPFKLKELAFANTTTDPAKNLTNIQNLYTANQAKMQVAYAMCGPDTQNWGTVLKQHANHKILIAGYDWLPRTLDLIQQGWVRWSLGSTLYGEPLYSLGVLYKHVANGTPLPTGSTHGKSTFATKANIKKVKNSPDVKYSK